MTWLPREHELAFLGRGGASDSILPAPAHSVGLCAAGRIALPRGGVKIAPEERRGQHAILRGFMSNAHKAAGFARLEAFLAKHLKRDRQ